MPGAPPPEDELDDELLLELDDDELLELLDDEELEELLLELEEELLLGVAEASFECKPVPAVFTPATL